MGLRKIRKQLVYERRWLRKKFEKHRRINIRAAEPGVHRFVIVLDHLKPTYNVGKIFRSADAFGAREVHLVGIPFFNPVPAMGSFKWVPARFHDDFPTCHRELSANGYRMFRLDPETGRPVSRVDLPEKSAFIFGHEEFGISFDPADYPDIQALTIPQFGKVQSLNVSIASAIVMYEYARRHGAHAKAKL